MMNMVKLETKLLMYTLYSRQFDGSMCDTSKTRTEMGAIQ